MDDTLPNHKLCGYLFAVLAAPEPIHSGTPCHLFSNGSQIGFKTSKGIVLSPLPHPKASLQPHDDAEPLPSSSEKCGKKRAHKRNSKTLARKTGVIRRKLGLVQGSLSVVHQIQALVAYRCIKIHARVLHVETGDRGEVRVVVLVDVYLTIEVFAGWQFLRYGSVAGALFKHLSCDWGKRTQILANCEEFVKEARANRNLWNLSDCHVLGCKLHYNSLNSPRKRLFELHEIFKSLPSVTNEGKAVSSRMQPAEDTCSSGIWDLADDILINILTALEPMDLTRVASTCRHLRSLAVLIMPCIKLKLFPHQQRAVEWMLKRERSAKVLPHPLFMKLSTEDGFSFYVNSVSGDIITEMAPTIRDFRGGMFCDEPGLGKTITALSLILKTQGTLADPPDGVQTIWCAHNGNQKCGYYELNVNGFTSNNMILGRTVMSSNAKRRQLSIEKCSPIEGVSYSLRKRASLMDPGESSTDLTKACPVQGMGSSSTPLSEPVTFTVQSKRNFSSIKRNLLYAYDGKSGSCKENNLSYMRNDSRHVSWEDQFGLPDGSSDSHKRRRRVTAEYTVLNETWVQCDACRKWRRLAGKGVANSKAAWFCSMNNDPARQRCSDPEEGWGGHQAITYLQGFYKKGTSEGKEENVAFFVSVLKEHYVAINSEVKKALNWLVKLSPERLSEMETIGLVSPILGICHADAVGFHKIFQAFGLIKRVEKGTTRWYYPRALENLAFDLSALRIALSKPLDSVRLYLSRATLIVVPSNLVDHWITQIKKHIRPGQLQLYVWNDHRKPPVHNLAWDYDIVITTFSRLSLEWGLKEKSAMMQVHWLRIILDEGHTLGSSLNLTNKMQMAVSLIASYRWLLTGTPTPNTPNSQLSNLQPLLMFLHEEAYGQNQKAWETGIFRPFEAEMEEGRSRLLQLLHRCMIGARKIDLQTIPPCIKKVTFLDFTDGHAKSYNELVATVRRNILMADWNDPSHVESLLNPKQWKFRSTTIRNVRLSCCVAGHIKVSDAGEDIQETMDMLIEKGLDPISEEHAFIKYNLLYGGNCHRCNEWCRLPVISPCRHLLCLNCVSLDSEKCTLPGCGNLYEMQTPETLARPENPNPKWPVPKDLIELQPSYKQDDWNPDWQSTSSSKVAYLVERLKALQEANREINCCVDDNNNMEHNDHIFRPHNEPYKTLPEKVIIFSQFLEHIHVIEQQLAIADIKFAGMYSPMPYSNKMKSLGMFQNDNSCMALLMDGSSALGLDLSFVNHVFLMEPIWDRSMEEQVISRAHRMGATRPIHVQTLAMRGTIEEQMLQFLQDADACRKFLKEESQKLDRDPLRTCRALHDFAESNYLAHLSFVRTSSKS